MTTLAPIVEPKRDQWGRYLLPDPVTGKENGEWPAGVGDILVDWAMDGGTWNYLLDLLVAHVALAEGVPVGADG